MNTSATPAPPSTPWASNDTQKNSVAELKRQVEAIAAARSATSAHSEAAGPSVTLAPDVQPLAPTSIEKSKVTEINNNTSGGSTTAVGAGQDTLLSRPCKLAAHVDSELQKRHGTEDATRSALFVSRCPWRPEGHIPVNIVAMETMNRDVLSSPRKTQTLFHQNTPLDLIDTGKGVKVQTEKPHLVSLGSGRLSTAITLLPLEEGRTTIGNAAKDIILQGPGLAPEHCYIENHRGTLTLYPCGNACAIDGLPVRQPTRLSQGVYMSTINGAKMRVSMITSNGSQVTRRMSTSKGAKVRQCMRTSNRAKVRQRMSTSNVAMVRLLRCISNGAKVRVSMSTSNGAKVLLRMSTSNGAK
ncbi:hypothetical protein NDU88_006679 [Pleurodeles waltl]|uniref:FHA domain-containing protein n=1 Tax=Pleurodeles waltl TaxID=8319 RepID=A0AAV7UQD9_PLEWA|nr:hypothetical protein NDU88_006679 [Pleurodeles waltl]